MSYDPSDEKLESLMNDILNAFDASPPRLKKRLLSSLVDEISLRDVILCEKGVNINDLELARHKEEYWGKVEDMRVQLAGKLLYSLMSEELP